MAMDGHREIHTIQAIHTPQSSTSATPSLVISKYADAFGRYGDMTTWMRLRVECGVRVIISLHNP
jgi:hypothetical protein